MLAGGDKFANINCNRRIRILKFSANIFSMEETPALQSEKMRMKMMNQHFPNFHDLPQKIKKLGQKK